MRRCGLGVLLLLLLLSAHFPSSSRAKVTGVWCDIESRTTVIGEFLTNATAIAHSADLQMVADAQVQWAFQTGGVHRDKPVMEQLLDIVDRVVLMDYWTACSNNSRSRSANGVGGLCDPTQALLLAAPWLSYAEFMRTAQNRTVRVDLGVALASDVDVDSHNHTLSPGRIPDELQLETFLQRSAEVLRRPSPPNHWGEGGSRSFGSFAVFCHSKYEALAPCPPASPTCVATARQPRAVWWYRLFRPRDSSGWVPLNDTARAAVLSWCVARHVTELYLDGFGWGGDQAVEASFRAFVKEAETEGIDISLYVGGEAGPRVTEEVAGVARWCADSPGVCGQRAGKTGLKSDDEAVPDEHAAPPAHCAAVLNA